MTYINLALILITILLISIGQLLFKITSNHINISGFTLATFLSPSFVCAIIIYIMATFFWLYVLRILPLKLAIPFTALTFIFIPILSFLFLGETLKYTNILGAIIIIFGVFISTR
jgi:undecaprenyl phosphate-alpha-L-ara4N flippase subunit ArnE